MNLLAAKEILVALLIDHLLDDEVINAQLIAKDIKEIQKCINSNTKPSTALLSNIKSVAVLN